MCNCVFGRRSLVNVVVDEQLLSVWWKKTVIAGTVDQIWRCVSANCGSVTCVVAAERHLFVGAYGVDGPDVFPLIRTFGAVDTVCIASRNRCRKSSMVVVVMGG